LDSVVQLGVVHIEMVIIGVKHDVHTSVMYVDAIH